MDPIHDRLQTMTRRHFFGRGAMGLGAAALTTLAPGWLRAEDASAA